MWIFILIFTFVLSMSPFFKTMPFIAGDFSEPTFLFLHFGIPTTFLSWFVMLKIFLVLSCCSYLKFSHVFATFLLSILHTVPICHLHPLSAIHSSLGFPWNSKLYLVQRNLPISKRHGTECFSLQEGSVLQRQSNIEKKTRCNNNNLLISKISSARFGQSFAHIQERETEIFTANGIVSCKDGYTYSYVVLMWYVVLINVIMISVCVVLCLGILLVFVF